MNKEVVKKESRQLIAVRSTICNANNYPDWHAEFEVAMWSNGVRQMEALVVGK